MTGYITECVRGCTRRDRHLADCDDPGICRGCEPRTAEHGKLCVPCHRRLMQMLDHIPEQCHLLTQFASMQAAPPARGDADLRHGTGEPPTPIRLACVDVRQEIEDMLSEIVEDLVQQHRMRGPKRSLADVDRETPGRRKRHWSPIMDGYLWVEPDPRFDVDTAAPWLRSQIGAMELLDGIGDTWEALADAMSQAHALAPWRAEAARLNGIPCPCCHALALTHFAGDTDVTCTRCNEQIPPARYAVWVRMLADEQRGTA